MKFIIASVIALATLAGYGFAHHEHTPPGKELYQSLPQDERLDFLAFSLGDGYTKNTTKLQRTVPDFPFPDALGINNELLEKFKMISDMWSITIVHYDTRAIKHFLTSVRLQHVPKTLEIPENFTTNLFVWIRARFNLDQTKMRELILQRSVCLSNGDCIDIGDIGGLCCPF